jgi:hypothetical protein
LLIELVDDGIEVIGKYARQDALVVADVVAFHTISQYTVFPVFVCLLNANPFGREDAFR